MKTVSAQDMRAIERVAFETFSLPGHLLMENAGRVLADETISFLKDIRRGDRHVAVLCGAGNNGGDGLVAARYLYNRGFATHLFLMKPHEHFTADAAANYQRARAAGIDATIYTVGTLFRDYDIIVDALLGTGTRNTVTGIYRDAIGGINSSGRPVIAADIPSGLDADSGGVLGEAVHATVTVTMGLAKQGLVAEDAREFVGKLVVADIGLPRQLLR
jgi:NAD(P)H-hydrate epimerase